MRLRVFLFALFAVAASAQARLGETYQQCVERYGPPLKVVKEDRMAYFQRAGFLISIGFNSDNKAELMLLWKGVPGDEKPKIMREEISAVELEQLLSVNGKDWKPNNSVLTAKEWSDASGTMARYETFDKTLIIITKECMARKNAEKEDKERKNLEGF